MEKLNFGETAVLENGKEFICFANVMEAGVNYAYLVSNYKPLEVRFAKQIVDEEGLKLEIIEDERLKEHLFDLFKNKMEN